MVLYHGRKSARDFLHQLKSLANGFANGLDLLLIVMEETIAARLFRVDELAIHKDLEVARHAGVLDPHNLQVRFAWEFLF